MSTGIFEELSNEPTIRDLEFTRIAERDIRRLVNSPEFEDMPPELIEKTIKERKKSFQSYLKRYLHKQAGIEEPFHETPDEVYQEIIQNAFEESQAPRSFEKTSTKWSATVKSWLRNDHVRRDTVFLLGFGLQMSRNEVSEFLMKVLQEDDFREDDPREIIFEYCFSYQQPYSMALKWMNRYPTMTDVDAEEGSFARGEQALARKLLRLQKQESAGPSRKEISQEAFRQLFDECRRIILEIYQQDEEEKPREKRREWTLEDINAGDLEQMICSGIPRNEAGNLVKSSLSENHELFDAYRLSRQRIDLILRGKQQPDRYDIITLIFFIFANQDIPRQDRLNAFMLRANDFLAKLGMGPVYAANPYEAFIMICTASDSPLPVYGDVWESSFAQDDMDF